ncbi:hypothetical protein NQ317_008802 [Molorchus minor]|uniref:Uncharacterized protein n=1 Tax=Molorchus minor TaxID=1323400 RepID=A0ABQ9J4U4_9CUCU|nr:hypothetical protein NQ317_008802 [Molorchus minor]
MYLLPTMNELSTQMPTVFPGICAKRAKIKPHNHPMFTYRNMHNDPCEFRNLITMHHFIPQSLRETYKALNDPDLEESCKRSQMFSSHSWLLNNILKPNNTRKPRCE